MANVLAALNSNAGGNFMSTLGTLGSAAIGAFAAGHGAYKQYKYQKALQKNAAKLNYEYAQKETENSPTWTRAGLEAGGYNPMLAVSNGTSGANANFTSAGSASAPDYVGGISAGVANAQSFQRLKNETLQSESVADANYANADKSKAEKASILEKLPFISKREKAEIANVEKDSLYKEAEIHNIDESIRLREKELELQEKLGVMGIDAQYYSANKSYNATKYHADKQKEIADEHSPSSRSQSFRNYMEGISAPLHGIGSILHSGNGKYKEETIEQTYDRNGNIKGVKTKEKTRKRK